MVETNSSNGGNLGFEKKLWAAADKMRSNMDAAEYKHVALGLIFLKYISDSFEETHAEISKDSDSDPEEMDEYKARNIFWVPPESRWNYLQKNAKQPTIGKIVDSAMDSIERENPQLKGVLPKDYAREALDKTRLGELIDLIGTIGLGDKKSKSKDMLGGVYEYFLGQFADAEGKKGGQFYTPKSISTTWKLCKMNMAIRGIESNIQWGDTFHDNKHKDLKADYILANPPFNSSDWNGQLLKDDSRWKYGLPPTGNANFAWVQHFIHHLSPTGIAGFVLANGSMSSNTSGEGEIRNNIVEDDLVDCMVALPSQLFYNTMIPACLWFLTRDKTNHGKRKRKGEILFIDARNMGQMIDRRHRELTNEEVKKMSNTYHDWRMASKYEDVPGFCKSAKLEEIEKHGFILTPGRYVGAETEEEDSEAFEEKMKRLTAELSEQMKEGQKLDEEIKKNLAGIGFR